MSVSKKYLIYSWRFFNWIKWQLLQAAKKAETQKQQRPSQGPSLNEKYKKDTLASSRKIKQFSFLQTRSSCCKSGWKKQRKGPGPPRDRFRDEVKLHNIRTNWRSKKRLKKGGGKEVRTDQDRVHGGTNTIHTLASSSCPDWPDAAFRGHRSHVRWGGRVLNDIKHLRRATFFSPVPINSAKRILFSTVVPSTFPPGNMGCR